jgi:cysteine synthase A
MRYRIEQSIIGAELMPEVIKLSDNLYAACFFVMKLLPAYHILERAAQQGIIGPGSIILESTSGSFGLALAIVCRLQGYNFIMVSDPVIDERLLHRLTDLGVKVEIVREPASKGGFQMARLARLKQLSAQYPGAYWPSQYDNPQNSEAYEPLARYLVDLIGEVDCLVGAVGSGGSMCGTGQALRAISKQVEVIGVDTFGSVLFGLEDTKRIFRGLGNSIMPKILDHSSFDQIHWVTAAEGFHATRVLHSSTALFRGPTSGAAFLAAQWWAKHNPEAKVVVLFPDEGYRYQDEVYNDDWLTAQGLLPHEVPNGPRLVAHPTMAGPNWSYINWNRRTLEQVLGSA